MKISVFAPDSIKINGRREFFLFLLGNFCVSYDVYRLNINFPFRHCLSYQTWPSLSIAEASAPTTKKVGPVYGNCANIERNFSPNSTCVFSIYLHSGWKQIKMSSFGVKLPCRESRKGETVFNLREQRNR